MPIILFDGVCNFCNRTVNTIIVHDKPAMFQFVPIQSKIANEMVAQYGLNQKALSSVILVEEHQVFIKTDAIIRIAANLSGWPRVFSLLKYIPKGIRDAMYDLVAKYRYVIFGKRSVCMVPDETVSRRFLK